MGVKKDLRKQVRELLAETDEYHDIMMRQSAILMRVANALNGPPPERSCWSWHDLGEKAEALVALLDVKPGHNMLALSPNDCPACTWDARRANRG